MTTIYIDEYTGKAEGYSKTSGRSPETVYPKRVTSQKITVSASSQVSTVVNAKTAFVSIRVVDGPVYIEIGKTPTATANSKYLAYEDVYDVDVDEGDKVAVINA